MQQPKPALNSEEIKEEAIFTQIFTTQRIKMLGRRLS